MNFAGKTLALAITGSIAAYKACDLIREAYRLGADRVLCIMSQSATQFVAPLTMQSLSMQPVYTDDLAIDHHSGVPIHIWLAQQADALVVFPATSNFVAKFSHGIADDLLTSTAISFTGKPIIIAPAMNTRMWDNPLTQKNLGAVKALSNVAIIEPSSGLLACGETGDGHLASQWLVFKALYRALHPHRMRFYGIKALVSAGGTKEPLDAVRVISNRSSGKMGLAMANALDAMGASVCLVTTAAQDAKNSFEEGDSYPTLVVNTAAEMNEVLHKHWPNSDLLVMAAAVSDCRAKTKTTGKLKTDELLSSALYFEKNPDIVASLAAQKRETQVVVGFAAETQDLAINAEEKRVRKNLDAIVANLVSGPDIGFDTDFNAVSLFAAGQEPVLLPKAEKWQLAEAILIKLDAMGIFKPCLSGASTQP
ncbi:MAG: bifunctional phosphopantothenoylcysteine decarboxylase/phosphopantothenate--cysteine ligase CoaBC [Cyanobacteria bacterium P01_H01_bin.74]